MTTARLIERAEYITPDGVTYDLFAGQRILISWTNFGMPPINYLSDRGPFQNGRTIRDFRLNQRTFTLEQHEKGDCRIDWWCDEAELIDALRPNRSSSGQSGIVRLYRPDDEQIQIDAYILRGPSGNWDASGDVLPNTLRESLQFVAADPIWELPETTTVTAIIEVADSCLPFCIPACIGGSIINDAFDVKYCGTWDGDVIEILINGPITLPVITNETTGKTIQLNYTAISGETITISIRPDIVTVENNFGSNLIGTVDNVSSLVTFTLVGTGDQSASGINQITFSGSGGIAGETQISFTYPTRHISAFAPCVDCLAYAQTVIETLAGDLLAYYRFNGGFVDSSGNGHGASGTAVNFVSGGVDSSSMMQADGLNTFVELPGSFLTDADAANLGDQGTVIVWFQPTDNDVWTDGTNRRIFDFEVDASNIITIIKLSTGEIRYRYEAGGVNKTRTTDIQTSNAPRMFTITWDNVTDEMVAYLNGEQLLTAQTGLGVWAGNFALAVIGAQNTAPIGVTDGFIDEVAIGTRAITATEVANIYAARGIVG